jgi:hypothetical protein
MPVERSQQAVTEVLWRGWRSAEQGAGKGGGETVGVMLTVSVPEALISLFGL